MSIAIEQISTSLFQVNTKSKEMARSLKTVISFFNLREKKPSHRSQKVEVTSPITTALIRGS